MLYQWDCSWALVMHVQVQLNLARRAIVRLQKVLGVQPPASHVDTVDGPVDIDGSVTKTMLQNASTDKLRVLSEFLIDTLLSMTNAGSTIPDIPATLYVAFMPALTASLFRSLCVHGTRKAQTHAGVLLVRVCAAQPWWGEFLGNMLEELFASNQTVAVFPHDRCFWCFSLIYCHSSVSYCNNTTMHLVIYQQTMCSNWCSK